MICTPHQMGAQEEWDGRGKWHVWGRGKVHSGCWWGDLVERDHFEDLNVDGRIILPESSRNGVHLSDNVK